MMTRQTTAHAGVSGGGLLTGDGAYYRATFCMKGLRTNDREPNTIALPHHNQVLLLSILLLFTFGPFS